MPPNMLISLFGGICCLYSIFISQTPRRGVLFYSAAVVSSTVAVCVSPSAVVSAVSADDDPEV